MAGHVPFYTLHACRRFVHSLVLLVLLWAPAATAGGLSPQEARGKQIFRSGSSAAGRDITAYVGQGSVPVPARVLPCANCHGPDGLGRPEGGVVPSTITWSHLTKPYGAVATRGRRRAAYTPEGLARAIKAGIDPNGNRLDPSMPRFAMDAEDMADLIAYLQRLETDLDPGLSDDRITLGTVVPTAQALRPIGQAIEAVLRAYFATLNAQGGIHGRQLELKLRQAPTREALLAQGKDLVEGQQVFALVGAFIAGVDDAYAALVEQHQVPLVGPFTQFPQGDKALQRFTFYLDGGLTVQGRTLLDYAARKRPGQKPRLAGLYPAGQPWQDVAQAIEQQASKHGWQAPTRMAFAPDHLDASRIARQLKAAGVEGLFFFGSTRELLTLGREAVHLAWVPHVFLAGSLVDRDILKMPLAFDNKIILAYPTTRSDHTPAGIEEFTALQRRHGLPNGHLPVQIATYAAAKVLVEGLKRVGQALSRDKLITALEGLYDFETQLTPAITYGPNRRIGALGASIVELNLTEQRFLTKRTWLTPR